MKRTLAFVAALLTLMVAIPAATSSCQVSPNARAQNAAAPKRDVHAEDAVAKLFENMRENSKGQRLHRIKSRKDLEQLTCTVAVTDRVPHFTTGFPVLGNNSNFKDVPSAIYRIDSRDETTPELQRIATYKLRRSKLERYSVAVWSSANQNGGQGAYWVAIKLYYGAGNEFFLDHFTDQIESKNEWKQFVAPQCVPPRR